MNLRHTVLALLAVCVIAPLARAEDEPSAHVDEVANDVNGGIAPTDAAVWGGFSGTFAGAVVGVGTGALAMIVTRDDNVAIATWAATVSLGAGAGAGVARKLAGDPDHERSAAVVTTIGTATAGVVGALSGVLVGHTQGDGVTGAALGFGAGTLAGAMLTPIAHGLVVE